MKRKIFYHEENAKAYWLDSGFADLFKKNPDLFGHPNSDSEKKPDPDTRAKHRPKSSGNIHT